MKFLYKIRVLPLLFGIVTLIIGFYYSAAKAGIPYQDPTPEMTEKYLSFANIGDKIMLIGLIIIIAAIALLVLIKIAKKLRKSHELNRNR